MSTLNFSLFSIYSLFNSHFVHFDSTDSANRRFQNLSGKDRNRRPFEKRDSAYSIAKIWGVSAPQDSPGSAGSENWGLTRQVITAPGYKIGSMSRLCPHFEFVCLVVHSQIKPSKCPSMAPLQQSPPRKLLISMSHVVSSILHFYAAHSCEQPHKSVIVAPCQSIILYAVVLQFSQLSGNHQQSFGSKQQLSNHHQAVIRQSSCSHLAVTRQS